MVYMSSRSLLRRSARRRSSVFRSSPAACGLSRKSVRAFSALISRSRSFRDAVHFRSVPVTAPRRGRCGASVLMKQADSDVSVPHTKIWKNKPPVPAAAQQRCRLT